MTHHANFYNVLTKSWTWSKLIRNWTFYSKSLYQITEQVICHCCNQNDANTMFFPFPVSGGSADSSSRRTDAEAPIPLCRVRLPQSLLRAQLRVPLDRHLYLNTSGPIGRTCTWSLEYERRGHHHIQVRFFILLPPAYGDAEGNIFSRVYLSVCAHLLANGRLAERAVGISSVVWGKMNHCCQLSFLPLTSHRSFHLFHSVVLYANHCKILFTNFIN